LVERVKKKTKLRRSDIMCRSYRAPRMRVRSATNIWLLAELRPWHDLLEHAAPPGVGLPWICTIF